MAPKMRGSYQPARAYQPTPAAFGSYSEWAGHSNQYMYKMTMPDRLEAHVGMKQTAAFKDTMRQAVPLEHPAHQPGPGAYDPHANTGMASAHSKKALTEQGAQEEKQPGSLLPDWLFSFNKVVLRDADRGGASSDALAHEPAPTGSSHADGMLPSPHDDRPVLVARSEADGRAESQRTESEAEELRLQPRQSPPTQASRALYFAINPNELRIDGNEVVRRKRERLAREAEEKRLRWEAKHWRGKHVPPPVASAARRKRHPGCKHNYYAILHVAPSASETEIKHAYHKLAKQWHPDRVHLRSEKDPEKAERMFKLVARAYQVVGDRQVRAAYDRGENVDARVNVTTK